MKHLLILFCFFSGIVAMGQVVVTVKPNDTVCYGDSVVFSAKATLAVTDTVTSYSWQKDGGAITGESDSILIISPFKSANLGQYSCTVVVNGITHTSNIVRVWMHPKMKIDTFYRFNALGCAIDCKAQYKTLVSGGTPFKNYPPYIYEWPGGFNQDTIVFGLCRGPHKFKVTDSIGCSRDTSYVVDFLKSPKIDFKIFLDTIDGNHPKDTVVYLTNPTIHVEFLVDSLKKHLVNWTWNFGDSVKVTNLNPASHTYAKDTKTGEIPIRLTITDLNGCDTTFLHMLVLKVAELKTTNLVTPNGDGANDAFKIQLSGSPEADFSQAYVSNELIIFDRWGKKVYDRKNY
ncbi:MAG: gliding motility-associated C-terminal domain-containing protein, partial [Bacteroidota bacterium]